MVGGDYLPRNLDCLAEDGRHVSIAVQGGASAEINIAKIMSRRLTLTGSTLRPRSVAFKSLVADEIARSVWPFVEEGRLKPVIHATFPLAQAPEAHRLMEAGDHVGKIVLSWHKAYRALIWAARHERGRSDDRADPSRICRCREIATRSG